LQRNRIIDAFADAGVDQSGHGKRFHQHV
jgi:hypothetical protein